MSLIRKHVAVLQAWACLDLVGSKVWFSGTTTGSFKFATDRPLLPWQRNLS